MLIEITYNVTDVFMSTTETPVYVEISFEQPGGSAAVWGNITGTLSDQTDLQNALNAKLDESTIDGGAEGQILSKASATDFDFAWINNYAKYLATNVRNQTGSSIAAFQVVYISGATGNKPLISLADADTEATSSKTYGVTATSIANNGTGDVVTAGELSGINTSAFNEGDLLWLSTTAGGVVTTPPAEPAHSVFIGYVVRSHPTLGVIDVAIANGYELNELHGVQITTPTDNQGLFYNSTSTLWENKSITTALGYTPVPTTRNITINGVTYDLSADRTWTIAAGISGSGASGQVTYWTGASAVSGSNNLFWDATNNGLVVGSNTISSFFRLGVNGNIVVSGASPYITFNTATNSGTTPAYIQYVNSTSLLNIISTGAIDFYTNANQRMRLFAGGNVLIGSTTDLGVRFGVIGDTLLRGSGNTSATTALTVQNSSSTNLFTVRNDGNVGIGVDPSAWASSFRVLQIGSSGSSLFGRIGSTVQVGIGTNMYFNGTNYIRIQSGTSTLYVQSLGVHYWQTAVTGAAGSTITYTDAMTLDNAGNLGIGIAPTVRLHVSGDTILRGSGATSATTALTVQNSDSTNLFRFRNDGTLRFGSEAVLLSSTGNGSTVGLTGRGLLLQTSIGTASSVGEFTITGSINPTSLNTWTFKSSTNFIPTSGTATYNGIELAATINQTGGANGITRGLYVNPTLTAAADFRAIETSAGNVLFGSNFFWDNTNGRLGIGTNAPAYTVDIVSNQNASTSVGATNTTSGTLSLAEIFCRSSNGYISFAKNSALRNAYKIFLANDGTIYNGTAGDIAILNDFATGRIKFAAGASSTSQMTLFANGNLAINSGVTDLGVRFGVVGDTLLRGSGATSATTALTVQNSSSTNLFRVLNDGKVNFSNIAIPSNSSFYVNIANGYVNYASAYLSGSFYTYQAFGSWEAYGADASSATILSIGGYRASQWAGITLHANGNEVMRVKQNGQIRFVPLASAPSGAEAGDVYYNSTDNKHYGYNGTTWNAFY